jgi:hypothetical protein
MSQENYPKYITSTTDPYGRAFAWQPSWNVGIGQTIVDGEPWPVASDGYNEILSRSKAKEELAAAKAAKDEKDWWDRVYSMVGSYDTEIIEHIKKVELRLAEAVRKTEGL